MLTVEKIDTSSKAQVHRFVRLPFRLFQKDPLWVPPIRVEHESQLDRKHHPFYEHSNADFFIAVRNGQDVGRIAVLENTRFNAYHHSRKAQFYFFDSENDQEIAEALFEQAFAWARQRGLDTIIGPKGLGPLDGFGILIDGFEKRQMMTMMNYNSPYYPVLLENLGFKKEVDFVCCYIDLKTFLFPEAIDKIATKVEERGYLNVKSFQTIKELKEWTARIGQAYNQAFVDNWEYYPLTEREVQYVVKSLEQIADPALIKIILHKEDVAGLLFAFPDISAAIQRSRGRLLPFGWIDMLLEMKRTRWIAVNTMGVLPEFQGRGGNALLYREMERLRRLGRFDYAVVYQVAETAVNMRRDLENVGTVTYKNHRVYTRPFN